MVVMFHSLSGSWHQILGVFASRGNVKAHLLSKIILEAVVLSEKAGLKVEYVICDGASWNRAMWHQFGVHGMAAAVTPSVQHPSGDGGCLSFLSDFPHLVKCVRNGFIKAGCKTPEVTFTSVQSKLPMNWTSVQQHLKRCLRLHMYT